MSAHDAPPDPRPDLDAALFGARDHAASGDRIPLEDGCALLGVRSDTFRDQYLSPERRKVFAPRLGLVKDDQGRETVSRRLILEHLDSIRREPWGGAYGLSGAWGRRARRDWEALRAYDAALEALSAAADAAPDTPRAADAQGELFAP